PARDAYKKAYGHLQNLGWLSKSDTDIKLSDQDIIDLVELLDDTCEAFGLDDCAAHILELASMDPLSAIKIVLAYYRRLQGLADYVATGKAQDIFHD
ncbi:hypothetical protein ACPTJI_35260, partial [Pseudomonas aeruginosa]